MLDELKTHSEALAAAVEADRNFFASIIHYVRRLRKLLITSSDALSQKELKTLAESIEEFFRRYRPTGNGFYIPPTQTSNADSTVQKINSLVSKIVAMPEAEFTKLSASRGELSAASQQSQHPWPEFHPKIAEVSKSRFASGHYADSVEAAFKEVNNTVKEIVRRATGQEYDGAGLMERAFSLDKPLIVLDDLSTETGRNIQLGYMKIYAGSMTGIRNPKAHGNIQITSTRAIHFLYLASLLMYKIDEKK